MSPPLDVVSIEELKLCDLAVNLHTVLPWTSLSYHILYYVYATAAPHTIAFEVLALKPYTGVRNDHAFADWETPREAKCLQRRENKTNIYRHVSITND